MAKHRVDNASYRMPYRMLRLDGGRKWMQEHRWIMQEHLGRRLSFNEVVHHVNGDTLDNRLENLRVMQRGDHTREHMLLPITVDGIKSMIANGLSNTAIARNLGCEISTVQRRLKAAGITNPNREPAPITWDVDEALKLREAGWSIPRIAAHLGITKEAIYYLRRARGLPF